MSFMTPEFKSKPKHNLKLKNKLNLKLRLKLMAKTLWKCHSKLELNPKQLLSNSNERSFQAAWFKRFWWLEYSDKKDSAFSFPCYLFGRKPIGRVGSDTFTVKGFNIWQKLNSGKECPFVNHEDIQKEILQMYAMKVQEAIRDEIRNAKFCLIVDESQDESKKEQMAICVRFVDRKGYIKERFLDLVHVKDTNALTLKNKILSSLSHLKLDVQDIRGQGYDGANKLFKALQNKSQDIINALTLVSTTKTLIQALRDGGWESLLDKVVSFCDKYNISVLDMNATCGDIIHSRHKKHDVMVEHHYRVDVFIVAIDSQLQELNNRFSESVSELLRLSATLDPRKSFNSDDICKFVTKYYPLGFIEQYKIELKLELQHYELDNDPKLKNVTSLSKFTRMDFGINTRDLDSIWEETGQDCHFTRRGSKICIYTVETVSGFLVTPSGYASDGGRILATTSERNRLKEALEDSVEQRRHSYKATSPTFSRLRTRARAPTISQLRIGPEHPPSPIEIPYVPEPEYPEYLAPSDDEAPLEDQPLPADASPIAASPDYVADFDPEEDPEEDVEDDQADYPAVSRKISKVLTPADGGDGDDEPSGDDNDDDTDDEDLEEEPFEEDDEEEEHPASTDSSAVPIVDLACLTAPDLGFEIGESSAAGATR
nr:hypothetical protein [Tanacetum cinerariifolium]